MIDSGASSNVAGVEWLERYASQNRRQWEKCLSISKKRFRFGDGAAVASLGTVIINAKVTCLDSAVRPFLVRTDVVLSKVPLLISRSSLHRVKGSIDFQTNILTFGRPSHSLMTITTASGHLAIPLQSAVSPVVRQSSLAEIYVSL